MILNLIVLLAMGVFMFVFLGAALLLCWAIGVGLPMWIALLMKRKPISTESNSKLSGQKRHAAELDQGQVLPLGHRELQWFVDWRKALQSREQAAAASTA